MDTLRNEFVPMENPEHGASRDSELSPLKLPGIGKDENEDVRAEEEQYICPKCRRFDLDEILSRKRVAQGGDLLITPDSVYGRFEDSNCSFCQALDFIGPFRQMISHKEWRYPLVVVPNTPPDRIKEISGDTMCLTFAKQDSKRVVRQWEIGGRDPFEPFQFGYLAEDQVIKQDCSALSANLINPSIDFNMVLKWLDSCHSSDPECRREFGYVPNMRLIHCVSRTVIPSPETHRQTIRYAALSYVWGSTNNSSEIDLVSRNGYDYLPAALPATIDDAILVTQGLGIEYLWVDRYCIQQNPLDETEKTVKYDQIARMHDIYGGAYITIIAAAGDGPHYGLPGVRNRKRTSPKVRVGPRTLFATLPSPVGLMNSSKWATRGWTYQEGLLSRRRLVFTDQQMYFQCRTLAFFEAYEMRQKEAIELTKSPYRRPYMLPLHFQTQTWSFNRINHYSSLSLTDPNDILNGILGVLNRDCATGELRHIAGLPVSLRSAYSFDQSWYPGFCHILAWKCSQPGERRHGFPSWSWTGWNGCGEIRYPSDGVPSRARDPFISVELPDGSIAEGRRLEKILKHRHDLSRVKFLHFRAVSYPLNLTAYSLVQTSTHSRGWPCYAIALNEDDASVPHDELGFELSKSGAVIYHYVDVLLVVKRDDHFERIGVSRIDRQVIRKIGTTVREFKLG